MQKRRPDCKCCLKCVSSINEESRSKILSELLHIENKDAQDIHLQWLIEVSTIKQKRPTGTQQAKNCYFQLFCTL